MSETEIKKQNGKKAESANGADGENGGKAGPASRLRTQEFWRVELMAPVQRLPPYIPSDCPDADDRAGSTDAVVGAMDRVGAPSGRPGSTYAFNATNPRNNATPTARKYPRIGMVSG